MITVFANANSGNIDLLQDTMQALSDAIQGRVAAEEAIQISQYDHSEKKAQQGQVKQNQIDDYVADTGKPLLLAGTERNVWPG